MRLSPIVFLFVLAGCTGVNSPHGATDSTEVVNLLKNIYRWHAKDTGHGIDFEVTVKDSFQTALNYDSFARRFAALQQTQFFSASFLESYRAIGEAVNRKLVNAHPPLLNEINFDFQDSDPWTWFQDDLPDFWDQLVINDYQSGGDSASLKWTVRTKDWSSEKYTVRFRKEGNRWKVAYMSGFDLAKYSR